MNRLIIQVLLLICSISAVAWCAGYGWWTGVALLPLVVFQCSRLMRTATKHMREFQQLVETVRYRDFSRRFNTVKGTPYIRQMHEGFNEICSTMATLNSEKEIQYQYLQKIIEMVDTGILSYDINSGKVLWMNRSFKNLLGIPVLKNFNRLRQRDRLLFENLQSLGNERSTVIRVTVNNAPVKVLVAAGTFFMQNAQYRLLAFQNVNEALDEAESKAWQRLLNVMTHEIMNSVAPVSSLAGTLKDKLTEICNSTVNPATVIEEIKQGIDTMVRRSNGLLAFAGTYRNLNSITELNISKVETGSLFQHTAQLMLPSLTLKGIKLEMILPDAPMYINADASLVEQIMINLILNATEALKETPSPRITLSAATNTGTGHHPVISVTDNGTGISDEIIDRIFIPFFTTRTDGSGIGLSLCKQIMILHRGSIKVESAPNAGSRFSLLFYN